MARSGLADEHADVTWLPTNKDFMRLAQTFECEPGQPVFQSGMPAEHLYVVQSGSVKLVRPCSDKSKDYILKILGPGELVGAEAFFGSGVYRAHAKAIQRSQLLVLGRSEVYTFLRRRPKTALHLLQVASQELESFEERLVETAYEQGEKRLAHQLLELSRRFGVAHNGGAYLKLDLTRTELAELVGLRPETTIRILSRWRDNGLLKEEDRHIVIEDRQQLEQLAEVETARSPFSA
ncbi:MAG: Crp/Fnr family transcriptional regulator [Candidatus Bipolaricaulia bacterium]